MGNEVGIPSTGSSTTSTSTWWEAAFRSAANASGQSRWNLAMSAQNRSSENPSKSSADSAEKAREIPLHVQERLSNQEAIGPHLRLTHRSLPVSASQLRCHATLVNRAA